MFISCARWIRYRQIFARSGGCRLSFTLLRGRVMNSRQSGFQFRSFIFICGCCLYEIFGDGFCRAIRLAEVLCASVGTSPSLTDEISTCSMRHHVECEKREVDVSQCRDALPGSKQKGESFGGRAATHSTGDCFTVGRPPWTKRRPLSDRDGRASRSRRAGANCRNTDFWLWHDDVCPAVPAVAERESREAKWSRRRVPCEEGLAYARGDRDARICQRLPHPRAI